MNIQIGSIVQFEGCIKDNLCLKCKLPCAGVLLAHGNSVITGEVIAILLNECLRIKVTPYETLAIKQNCILTPIIENISLMELL